MSDQCKSCDAEVKWVRMVTGGKMLVNLPPEKRIIFRPSGGVADAPGGVLGAVVDAYTSHFVTCPKADEHRRRKC